jgi:hypothetical protein
MDRHHNAIEYFLQFFISSVPKTELQPEIESVRLKVGLLLLSLLNARDCKKIW